MEITRGDQIQSPSTYAQSHRATLGQKLIKINITDSKPQFNHMRLLSTPIASVARSTPRHPHRRQSATAHSTPSPPAQTHSRPRPLPLRLQHQTTPSPPPPPYAHSHTSLRVPIYTVAWHRTRLRPCTPYIYRSPRPHTHPRPHSTRPYPSYPSAQDSLSSSCSSFASHSRHCVRRPNNTVRTHSHPHRSSSRTSPHRVADSPRSTHSAAEKAAAAVSSRAVPM